MSPRPPGKGRAPLRLHRTVFALALPAVAQRPYAKPDDSWITLTGTVAEVRPQQFTLDYGPGNIVVEMDDFDDDADAYKVVSGDEVTVSGMIDDDLFETRTIEAASVYVKGLNAYFYASSADEEDSLLALSPPVVSTAYVRGTVSAVDGREFTINTVRRSVRVGTSGFAFNPMDDDGFVQIDVGDRVSVTGRMDDDLFEGRELMARSLAELFTAGR